MAAERLAKKTHETESRARFLLTLKEMVRQQSGVPSRSSEFHQDFS
jgi:hypothetical protein